MRHYRKEPWFNLPIRTSTTSHAKSHPVETNIHLQKQSSRLYLWLFFNVWVSVTYPFIL